uniref:Uncharacterized protein n=1 Tax=Picea sitchensis TaxID=3332 RepID=A9P2H8_PICSI|nr:unknown [Picea sitchensis]
MKYDLGNQIKRYSKSSKRITERQSCMLLGLICRLLLCGYHRYITIYCRREFRGDLGISKTSTED